MVRARIEHTSASVLINGRTSAGHWTLPSLRNDAVGPSGRKARPEACSESSRTRPASVRFACEATHPWASGQQVRAVHLLPAVAASPIPSPHILRAVEELGSSGSLYPKGQKGLAKALGWWIEKGSFMNAVCLTIGNMPGLPQELVEERRPLFRVNLDPETLRPKRAMYLQRVNAHIGSQRSWPTVASSFSGQTPPRLTCQL